MASIKFDLPMLDYKMRVSLWQVKMRAILTQSNDLDDALDKFGDKEQSLWTADEKKRDRKAVSLIQLHLSNDILQEVLQEKTAAKLWAKLETICMSKDLTSKIHEKMRGMVQKEESSSSKGDALQVRGRPEQRDNHYHNNNRDKSKGHYQKSVNL